LFRGAFEEAFEEAFDRFEAEAILLDMAFDGAFVAVLFHILAKFPGVSPLVLLTLWLLSCSIIIFPRVNTVGNYGIKKDGCSPFLSLSTVDYSS
jgi:hypothetical protein